MLKNTETSGTSPVRRLFMLFIGSDRKVRFYNELRFSRKSYSRNMELRKYLGKVFRDLSLRKESQIVEGHLRLDHVHVLVSIPPKHSVSEVVGFIKGKSAIHISREFAGRSRSFVGEHFWARGYFVSTLGRDERAIRAYLRTQELEDRRQEQLRLDERSHP